MSEITEVWVDEAPDMEAMERKRKIWPAVHPARAKPSFRNFLRGQASDPILAAVSAPPTFTVPTYSDKPAKRRK